MNKLMLSLPLITALTACHQDNPLKTEPPRRVALFLMNASANVEKRLHFPIQKDSFGYAYLECMEGKQSIEIHCEHLFKGMLQFAQENHYPAFKNVTLENLRDKALFERVADDYAELAATTWPRYEVKA